MKSFFKIILIFFVLSSVTYSSDFNFGSGKAALSKYASSALITAMEHVSGRIYAVGVHGIIIYSDDDGENWTQSENVPYTNTLTDISCPTIELCWATGHDSTILHSSDNGLNWNIQYQDIDFDAPLLSIHMYDDKNGIALGAFALSLRTNDGGNSWGYLFISDDDYQPHLNYAFSDPQLWRLSAANEGFAVGELGKFYLSPDKGLTWMTIDTGYPGSLWSGIKADVGIYLLLGMSGNIIIARELDPNAEEPSADMFTGLGCFEGGMYDGDCKVFTFEYQNIGVKNSLTNAIILDDGRIAISGNSGTVTIVDLFNKKNIETCVRSDRLSNTSIVNLGNDEFLIAGQKGIRKHSMSQCYENFVSDDPALQDSYYTVDLG